MSADPLTLPALLRARAAVLEEEREALYERIESDGGDSEETDTARWQLQGGAAALRTLAEALESAGGTVPDLGGVCAEMVREAQELPNLLGPPPLPPSVFSYVP